MLLELLPLKMAAQRDLRVRIGLLVWNAPITKLLYADRLPRDCAANVSAVLENLKLAVEIADLGLLPKCKGTLDSIHALPMP